MAESTAIFCNARLPDGAMRALQDGIGPHRLIVSSLPQASNLVPGAADPAMGQANLVFGQPDVQQVLASPGVKWIHLTSAGYTRYDTPDFRRAFQSRGGILTTSSAVFAEPCAQHVLAFLLAHARQIPQAVVNQSQSRGWPYLPLRAQSQLLLGKNVLIFGYGSIARRLCELLSPFGLNISAVRRNRRGDENVAILHPDQAEAALGQADFVINILPASAETERYFDASRFAKFKNGAVYCNIGRGASNDQIALRHALENGKLGAAYLDVTTPEPLAENDPLWKAPNCWITPHTAGGHVDEADRLVAHFLANLRRYDAGNDLLDRVI